MQRHTGAIIIGAGQAGLALSRSLTLRGVEHVLLERGRPGERWHSERWPGLRLLTPDWMNRLPGMAPPKAPSGFMHATAFAATLDAYAQRHAAPVETGCEVTSLSHDDGCFRVATSRGDWSAPAAVIASGACDQAAVPAWATELPADIEQLATTRYRGAEGLDPGGVLVVGASATGVQIAAEVRASGRKTVLAVGRHVRSPRRYRGKDVFEWLELAGFLSDPRPFGVSAEKLMSLPSMQLTGSSGGRAIGLATLAEAGIRVVGRALDAAGHSIRLGTDLPDEIIRAEARRQTLLRVIDHHVALAGLRAPEDPGAWAPPAPIPAGPARLDLRADGIRTVIWATGFRRRYPWLHLPVLDARGELITDGGVTPVPGLFALGLPYMRHRSSAFIHGVGRDADAIAARIHAQIALPRHLAA
ncbi:flavin-containing monooxygenase [Oceanibium sediminis]|uniref:flavin-containing monooxygenase n=1 Tax=Oceanibium sediminis TaxID=2026339 RepID=UPI000DD4A0D7|nr:NAD(P)/FAD-dependent oxidoreductase [Oceanibium sediminis]